LNYGCEGSTSRSRNPKFAIRILLPRTPLTGRIPLDDNNVSPRWALLFGGIPKATPVVRGSFDFSSRRSIGRLGPCVVTGNPGIHISDGFQVSKQHSSRHISARSYGASAGGRGSIRSHVFRAELPESRRLTRQSDSGVTSSGQERP